MLVFGKLAEIFLKKAMPDFPLKISVTEEKYDKTKDFEGYDRVVVPLTADDEAELFYSEITDEKPDFEENEKNS